MLETERERKMQVISRTVTGGERGEERKKGRVRGKNERGERSSRKDSKVGKVKR